MKFPIRIISVAVILILTLPALVSCDTDDIKSGMELIIGDGSNTEENETANDSFIIGGNSHIGIGGVGFETGEGMGIVQVIVDEDGNMIYIYEDGSEIRVDEDGNVILEDDERPDETETEYVPETVILPDGEPAVKEDVEILDDGTVMVTDVISGGPDGNKCYLPDGTYAIVRYYDSDRTVVEREDAYRAYIKYFMENGQPLGIETIRISDRVTLEKTEYEYLAEDVTGQGGADGFIYHHTATVEYIYDENGNLQNVARSEYVTLHGDNPVAFYYYDAYGNLEFYNEYKYYMNGQVEWEVSYHGDGTESSRYHYDENGVMTAWYQFDEEGNRQRIEFYKDGVITSCEAFYEWGHVETTYVKGRLSYEMHYNNDGSRSFHSYDPETENLMKITRYSEDDEVTNITEYVYREDNSRKMAIFYDADVYPGVIEYYDEDGIAVKRDYYYYHMGVIYYTVYYREDGYTYLRVEYFDTDGNPDYIEYYDENGNLIEE